MRCRNLLLFCVILFSHQLLVAQKNISKPNIIYIMADDLGYADLSCYGRKDYQTPNLDELCSQGVKFMNAYAAAPLCTPTRTAFMTGRYPAHLPVGLREPLVWTKKDTTVGLSNYPTLPLLLKNAGYETFLVGKWHLGFLPQYSPLKNGYDEFFGFHGGAFDYFSHTNPNGENDLYENEKPIKREGYATNIWANKAVEIIKRKHSKPFFLSVMFNAPHWPWQAPDGKPYPQNREAWQKNGSPEIFAGMMRSLDSAVGRIVKAIDDLQLEKNTVIIFTSDNGGDDFSESGIYKGSKGGLWEGGIHEPAFVRWTGKIKENSVTHQVVTTMDWTATILSLAGAKADTKFPLEGIDIMPMIIGKEINIDRTLYWRTFQRIKNKAVRDGKWKWIQDEKGEEWLFDLSSDPSEQNNVKEKFPEVFIRLKNKFSEWEKTVLAPAPL